MINVGKITI